MATSEVEVWKGFQTKSRLWCLKWTTRSFVSANNYSELNSTSHTENKESCDPEILKFLMR